MFIRLGCQQRLVSVYIRQILGIDFATPKSLTSHPNDPRKLQKSGWGVKPDVITTAADVKQNPNRQKKLLIIIDSNAQNAKSQRKCKSRQMQTLILSGVEGPKWKSYRHCKIKAVCKKCLACHGAALTSDRLLLSPSCGRCPDH